MSSADLVPSAFTAEQQQMLEVIKDVVARRDAASTHQILAIVLPLLPRELAAELPPIS